MVAQVNRIIIIILFVLGFLGLLTLSAEASPKEPSIISDDETESLLHQIVRPLYQAADIPFSPDKIHLLDDTELNAFVTMGNNMFINTGVLLAADNVNQISGILAHETGHIQAGHIARQQLKMKDLNTLQIVSLLAAGGAAAAGQGDAAMAVLMGSQSSLLSNILRYHLADERSADESAVAILRQTNQSPVGLRDFMKKIRQNNRLTGIEEDAYFRTHPLSSERQNFFEKAAKESHAPQKSALDDALKMVKAKLAGFLLPTDRAWKLYPKSNQTKEAQYAHAILYYRENNLPLALETLDRLIAAEPQNPFFYELKGQFYAERGMAQKAVTAYKQALKYRPQSAEIKLGWASAALDTNKSKAELQEIINVLNQIQIKRPMPIAWLYLSRAYAEQDNKAAMFYATARWNADIGNKKAARQNLKQAEQQNASAELSQKIADFKIYLNKEE